MIILLPGKFRKETLLNSLSWTEDEGASKIVGGDVNRVNATHPVFNLTLTHSEGFMAYFYKQTLPELDYSTVDVVAEETKRIIGAYELFAECDKLHCDHNESKKTISRDMRGKFNHLYYWSPLIDQNLA